MVLYSEFCITYAFKTFEINRLSALGQKGTMFSFSCPTFIFFSACPDFLKTFVMFVLTVFLKLYLFRFGHRFICKFY